MNGQRLALGSALLLALGAAHPRRAVHAAPAPPTWRSQIAPILFDRCASCHHAGGSGPFALSTYAEAKRWGTTIQAVTGSRYMPPWLPEPGYGHFAGDRRLPSDEIATIDAWVKAGMPEGDGRVPLPPVFDTEWALGPPDLIVEMPEAMQVPASGTDLFENFVLPVSLDKTRWVRAIEIKPGSAQVTHHANVIVDRTASVRQAHPGTWRKGIPGMDILVDSGDAFDPDSHFLFWKPDSTALVEPENMPWRLDPGNDLVLNMHLKPTGKPETVRARIGLYFAGKPATAQPMLLQLENDAALDIPAGAAAFTVEDQLQLPIAVDVLGIYPHAHYLGKRMEAWALLPDGARRPLVRIDDWDIDRQSVYRLAEPLALPAGTVVHMRYVYDNSAANIRNPNTPPLRVRAGNRSDDEMAHLWLQVLPHPDPARPANDPRRSLERAWMESRLAKSPHDELAAYNLASLALADGDPLSAAQLYRTILAERPADPRTLTSLGSALQTAGDLAGAEKAFTAAIASDPAYPNAIFDLATLKLHNGQPAQAKPLFRKLLAANPADLEAQSGLSAALLAEGDLPAARDAFARVLASSPDNIAALTGMAQLELQAEHPAAVEPLVRRILAQRDDADAHRLLAFAYIAEEAPDRARPQLEAWSTLARKDPDPHRALALLYNQTHRLQEALREEKIVVQLAPDNPDDWNDLGVMEARAGDRTAARRDLEHALDLNPAHAAARSNLNKLVELPPR